MFGFTSYYWHVDDLSEADERAVNLVDDADTTAEKIAAYRILLRSDNIAARGMALDQYHYAEAQWRWGQSNPVADLEDEILACARGLLANEFDPAASASDQSVVIRGWCSALDTLWHLGEPSDLPAVSRVLTVALTSDADQDFAVLAESGFQALESCLDDADESTCQQVGAWLAGLFSNEDLPYKVRKAAVQPFTAPLDISRALGQEAALTALLRHSDIRLAAEAGIVLLNRDPTNELVREIANGWPEDAPSPAFAVRNAIKEGDVLAQARAVVAAVGSSAPPSVADLTTAAHQLIQGQATDIDPLLAAWDAHSDDSDLADPLGSAVQHCLHNADEPTCQRVSRRLATMASDENLPVAVRVAAMKPFFTGKLDPDPLMPLLHHADLRLSAQAAWVLVDFEQHVPLVREIAATWPADAPDPAGRVREELESA